MNARGSEFTQDAETNTCAAKTKLTTPTRSWDWRDLLWGALNFFFWATGLRWVVLRHLDGLKRTYISCLDYFPQADPHDIGKRHRLSPRTVSMARKDDLVVTFHPPSMAFTRYLSTAHGFRHQVLAPETLMGEHGGDLLHSICVDQNLLTALREHGGVLTPLIQRRRLLELAEQTGLRLPGTRLGLILNDDVLRQLNNKQWFQEICHRLGIPLPNSEWRRGKANVLYAAMQLLKSHPELRLRKAVSAGGLAVVPLTRPEQTPWRVKDLTDQLSNVDWSIWDQDDIAVEPLLPVGHPFSVMFQVTSVGPILVETCDRIVFGSSESGGGITPSILPTSVLRAAIRMTMRFGWHLWSLGYRGDADMDWGLMTDGGLVAFESNVRTPATMIQVALRTNHNHGQGVALSRDFIRTGATTKIDDVVDFLRGATMICARTSYLDLNWKADRGFGVFITLEPSNGVMAYVVLGHSRAQVQRINEILSHWCAEQSGTSAPPVAASGT